MLKAIDSSSILGLKNDSSIYFYFNNIKKQWRGKIYFVVRVLLTDDLVLALGTVEAVYVAYFSFPAPPRDCSVHPAGACFFSFFKT